MSALIVRRIEEMNHVVMTAEMRFADGTRMGTEGRASRHNDPRINAENIRAAIDVLDKRCKECFNENLTETEKSFLLRPRPPVAQLTYFKDSGKYYGEGSYVYVADKPIDEIWQEVKAMNPKPGLSGDWYGPILINCPGHPHDHPHLVMP